MTAGEGMDVQGGPGIAQYRAFEVRLSKAQADELRGLLMFYLASSEGGLHKTAPALKRQC